MNNTGFWIQPNGYGGIVADHVEVADAVTLGKGEPHYRGEADDMEFFVQLSDLGDDGFVLQINGTDMDAPTRMFISCPLEDITSASLTSTIEALLLLAGDHNS